MPPRTTRNTARAVTEAKEAKQAKETTTTTRYALPPETDCPPQLFVLPAQATAAARIVTLPHPRQTGAARYLVCPASGVYEFTRIAPEGEPRSWLVTEKKDKDGKTKDGETEDDANDATPPFDPLTIKHPDLFVATAVDPLFLLLPALAAGTTATEPSPKRMFLAADDHLDTLAATTADSHASDVLRDNAVRARFVARMAAVCDAVAAGDEPMFRLNEDKLLLTLVAKAQRMAQRLPASMEGPFVTAPLQAPVVGVKRAEPPAPSQARESGGAAAATDDAPVCTAMQASEAVVALQRLRVAFEFVCARYVPRALADLLQKRLPAAGGIDFGPLDAYLAQLAQIRKAAAAARTAALAYGHKRGLVEDDDPDADADERAAKKRKQEEEERRRKAGESRGVRDLKKVDVSGMRKMSDFFKKKG